MSMIQLEDGSLHNIYDAYDFEEVIRDKLGYDAAQWLWEWKLGIENEMIDEWDKEHEDEISSLYSDIEDLEEKICELESKQELNELRDRVLELENELKKYQEIKTIVMGGTVYETRTTIPF